MTPETERAERLAARIDIGGRRGSVSVSAGMASESGVDFGEPASLAETAKGGSSRDEKLGHIADCADSCCGHHARAFVCRRAEGSSAGPRFGSKGRAGAEFPGGA